MAWLIAAPVIAFVVFLVVGGLTGRVKMRGCCTVADPRRDRRMRDVGFDEAAPRTTTKH